MFNVVLSGDINQQGIMKWLQVKILIVMCDHHQQRISLLWKGGET